MTSSLHVLLLGLTVAHDYWGLAKGYWAWSCWALQAVVAASGKLVLVVMSVSGGHKRLKSEDRDSLVMKIKGLA